MIDTRLIMLEGLPSTGKSTNSDFLRMQLELNGKKVKWIHEVAYPHPTLFFSEACLSHNEYDELLKSYPASAHILNSIADIRKNTIGIDLLKIESEYTDVIGKSALKVLKAFDVWNFKLDKYEEAAFDKWEVFLKKSAYDDTVYILDSSIFQAQIFTFLWDNAPYERLEKFVTKLCNIVKSLNPTLIYLYREDVESTINYLEKDRGTQSLEETWERDKNRPYYANKPDGAEGFKQFLRDYASFAKSLFNSLDCRKTSIEISQMDWLNYENKMLSFLGLDNIPQPKYFPPSGVYKNEEFNCEIIVDGLMMTDPDGNKKKLTPKTANEFYIECLTMILRFENSEQIVMSGSQINAHWSTTGLIFNKVGI